VSVELSRGLVSHSILKTRAEVKVGMKGSISGVTACSKKVAALRQPGPGRDALETDGAADV
jgi:hypothetical protein